MLLNTTAVHSDFICKTVSDGEVPTLLSQSLALIFKRLMKGLLRGERLLGFPFTPPLVCTSI